MVGSGPLCIPRNQSASNEFSFEIVEGPYMRKKKVEAPEPSTAPCAVCEGIMTFVRTIPAAGIMPDLHCFSCSVCGCPRTEEPQLEIRPIAA
jgi:hypothetical protein